MEERTSQTVRFGVFELDVSAGELRKQGIRVKLQAQPLQILALLLNSPGSIVSREEIKQNLWPTDTFVDFDRSLNTAINKLREALGDSAQAPRFIETIPRRGYRFVAPVERPERLAATAARRALWPGVGGSIVVVLLLALIWSRQRGVIEPWPEPRPLTSYPGSEGQASFSPDGGQFAFTWDGGRMENFDIYVQAIGAERPLRLTSDPLPDISPAWSPRGELIAFLRSSGDTASLNVVPATGGEERRVASIHIPVVHYAPTQLAWLPDGRGLVAPDRPGNGKPPAMFLWDLDTGQRRQLTFPPLDSEGDQWPSMSPDGSYLLFSRGPATHPRLYRASMDSLRHAVEVKAGALRPTSGIWSGKGQTIIAAAGVQHWSGLWLIPEGAKDTPVPIVRYPAGTPAISTSGRRLAYARADWDANIWQLPLRAGGSARPLITSSYVDHLPDLSPDGRRVAFVSSRSGTQQVHVADLHGSGLFKVTSAGTAGAPRWSPKGDRLAYQALTDKHQHEIYVVHVNGSGVDRLTDNVAEDITPSWSANGEWIYFASNRAGPYDIWKMRRTGAELRRITYGGGLRPIPSEDERYLYYAKDQAETSLWRVSVNGGPQEMVVPSLSNCANFAVMRDRIILIPRMNAALRSTIESFQPATGKSEVLMRLERRPVWGLAANPEIVLFSQADRDSSDLMIIDPFPPQ